MGAKISYVTPGSSAFKAKILAGDTLVGVNGKRILDVLDYKFYAYDTSLELEILRDDQVIKIKILKHEGEDLGLDFETYLMDKKKSCANKCIFCFIDQNPDGMRETIYFKDDDARLSFLLGNYISLTNLSQKDVERMIKMKLSPVNISVHTTNPELRTMMLGNKRGGDSLEILKQLSNAGIRLNTQIVVCQDVNDKHELERSLNDLAKLKSVSTISVVPAGITNHREGLFELKPVTKENAQDIIRIVEEFGEKMMEQRGTSLAFCGDELYVKADLPLRDKNYYEDMEQLENGVGMLSLMKWEFEHFMSDFENSEQSFTIATGNAAFGLLSSLIEKLKKTDDTVCGDVIKIENKFYGNTVSVAGLITGQDLICGLKDKKLGSKILITENMLRDGEGIFLDNMTLSDVENVLGVPIVPVKNDGYELLEEIYRR